MQYVWLAVLIAAIIAEAATAGLVSIWFVPSALLAMILAFCNVPSYIQVAVFFGVSILLLVLSRTLWKKYTTIKPVEQTNADALIGQTAVVTVPIDNLRAMGEVKVCGQCWSARSKNGECIEQDAHVKVLAIEGVKLICEKEN